MEAYPGAGRDVLSAVIESFSVLILLTGQYLRQPAVRKVVPSPPTVFDGLDVFLEPPDLLERFQDPVYLYFLSPEERIEHCRDVLADALKNPSSALSFPERSETPVRCNARTASLSASIISTLPKPGDITRLFGSTRRVSKTSEEHPRSLSCSP